MRGGAMAEPNVKTPRTIVRELAPRSIRRSLECLGGPEDGERKLLEADETSVDLAAGRYLATSITSADGSREVFLWRPDSV